ncbi:MAG: hypothetical protein M1825_000571 [Sarcosagium campestre]|nr:MAG: hypothetical protein M1825_000571 [Sarcosagium campestre]
MPPRLAAPVLTVDTAKIHRVDTMNAENLFSMWTVFSKCADYMEEGRRLENLSWRLWNRQTFCCDSRDQALTTSPSTPNHSRPAQADAEDIPALSASVESVASDEAESIQSHPKSQSSPLGMNIPIIADYDSVDNRSRGREKQITSLHLEKMIMTIKEKKELEPLPVQSASISIVCMPRASDITPRAISPTASSTAPSTLSDNQDSQPVGSETSVMSEISSHSIVRGFSPGRSSSYRSQARLAPTTPASTELLRSKGDQSKRKSQMFMLGGSSGEDESSLEEHMKPYNQRSSLSDGIKHPATSKKQTSFKEEVATRTINEGVHEDEDVFTDDESAIDDDDSSDWEDSVTESGRSSVDEKPLFQRVDSKPQLTSRRSLLTNLLHQNDRAAALANAASRSTPAMQRSRTSSPNGPSLAASPEDESALEMRAPDIPRSKPIIMTTSNAHPPALSPRTTRRNMLATELTESLRKHLLWERQQKNTTATAVLKRRHTSQDVSNLQEFPGYKVTSNAAETSRTTSLNHYFDNGLGQYHQKGW